jgi:hypothetical protein
VTSRWRLPGAALVALALAGCGTPSPDLFVIERSGADRNANLEMLVNDGGSVTCEGERHGLDAERLLTARELARDLQPQAALNLELPPGPAAQLTYRVSLQDGAVEFSDTSPAIPLTFQRLAAFAKDVAERVCGIER